MHPRDVWSEVTGFGSTTPEYMLVLDGREADVVDARNAYVLGRIGIDELERQIEDALTGRNDSPFEMPRFEVVG